MPEQFYQKYGARSIDPAKGLQAGLDAQRENLKNVLGGVKDLMGIQEQKYKDKNTLNMQEYLKGQIKTGGLGADPVDLVAIKQKFGGMIDSDAIEETITSEGRKLEETAINTAAQAASKTDDPLESNRIFRESLKNANAKQSLITSATQAHHDSNKLKFQDLETAKLQETQRRTNKFLTDVAESGDIKMGIEAAVMAVPEKDRPAERRRMEKVYEEDSALSRDQRENKLRHVQEATLIGEQRIRVKENLTSDIEARLATAQDSGITDRSYKLADSLSLELGGSAVKAIGDRVTNIWESLSGSDDAQVLRNKQKELLATGAKSDDIDAAIVQAYQESGGEGNWFGFKDISAPAMRKLLVRATELTANKQYINSISSELSDARQAVSDEENLVARELIAYDAALLKAGRRTRLRIKDQADIDTTAANYSFENQFKKSILAGDDSAVNADDSTVPSPLDYLGGADKVEGLGVDPDAGADVVTKSLTKRPLTRTEIKDAAIRGTQGPPTVAESTDLRTKLKKARELSGAKTIAPQTVKIGQETRKGGSRSWRNNNPGNLKYAGGYARKQGATGKDENGFAIFPDMATGDAARESLVFDSKDYKNLTLSKAIAKYAPRKDKSGKIINDTAAYQKKVLASIGNKDKKMDDYTNQERAAILHAMMEHEGFEEGDIS